MAMTMARLSKVASPSMLAPFLSVFRTFSIRKLLGYHGERIAEIQLQIIVSARRIHLSNYFSFPPLAAVTSLKEYACQDFRKWNRGARYADLASSCPIRSMHVSVRSMYNTIAGTEDSQIP